MPLNDSFDEPTIPPWLRRPLAAVWISLGLHAALIALVQVAPPAATSQGEPVIEARLVLTHTAPSAVDVPPLPSEEVDEPEETPQQVPLLTPSETAEALLVVAPPAVPLPPDSPPSPAGPPAEPQPASAPAAPIDPAPPATITSSVDLTYYSAREVDVQARPLRKIDPKYPPDADRKRLSGKVRVRLKIEADGRVSDIEFISATPPEIYDASSLEELRDVPFAPAQKNGRPVRELFVIEVEYDWEGRRR